MKKVFYPLACCCLAAGVFASCGGQKKANAQEEPSKVALSYSKSLKAAETDSLNLPVDENGYINLTDSGMAIAGKIYERHTFLTSFLTSIGVDPETAAEDACKIEHVISSESFSALKKYLADNEKN